MTRRAIRSVVACTIALITFVVVVLVLRATITRVWTEARAYLTDQRVPGLDYFLIRDQRRARLDAIAESFQRFREEHGRFPGSMSEWRQFDPNADDRLHMRRRPRLSSKTV